ncbi:DUF2993 domain-containing protein [Sporichthya sp.]|uniref:LmeA family phospholipid-binding protein n=1 Tax=Sporichthya sp. TaxID=65475 RepID=UPI0017CA8549|nr:DUF2993 domain-containing protein [Sporichthya sp.]MBA3745384.1 DUF2993 domain-containing protein [Sporichthya sp.]
MRRGRFWAIAAVVVVVLLLVVDRGGQMVVEGLVKEQIQKSLATPDKPSVDMSGFPFLPQLISQKFDDVTVDIRDADAGQIRAERVSAVLTGVKREGAGAQVDSLSGTGRISYAAATAAAGGYAVSYGGKNLVKISGKVRFAGQTRTASASGKPRIVGNELLIRPEQVSVDGTAAPVSGLIPDIRYPLREIPQGMTIKINPTEAGIEFSFDGENLMLSSADITAAWGLWSVSPDETVYARPQPAT